MAVHFVGAVAGTTTEAMINSKNEAGDNTALLCCASCGTAGVDDVKLKKCACGLVKYCSIACQKNHRSQHKKLCKKRLAELSDKALFKQPDGSHRGDCPICLLPIPHYISQDTVKSTVYYCCSKVVCNGCSLANEMREEEAGLKPSCPFCRHELPETGDEGGRLNQKKRAALNDPVALDEEGMVLFREGDHSTAIKYWEKAAGLGNIESHYKLSTAYGLGQGVEKDSNKLIHHLKKAAMGGHVIARYNLGVSEFDKGNIDRAVKHFIIAANLGCDLSVKVLKKFYVQGVVGKDDFAAALRAHQAAVDATKSPQREAAEVFLAVKREG